VAGVLSAAWAIDGKGDAKVAVGTADTIAITTAATSPSERAVALASLRWRHIGF
jgi:hypothetical protein